MYHIILVVAGGIPCVSLLLTFPLACLTMFITMREKLDKHKCTNSVESTGSSFPEHGTPSVLPSAQTTEGWQELKQPS